MKKKVLAMALVLVLCLSLLPATALAADGDFVIIDGYLFGYRGSSGDVVIPDGVISIVEFAFENCKTLTSVSIPSSVSNIGWGAFRGCTSLTSVTIQSGVTSIGDEAFRGCDSLTRVTIPSSVTSIGVKAFSDTPWLASLGEFAIANGILLVYQGNGGNVTIPSSVTSIGEEAFLECESLTSVSIPSGVISIGNGAFNYCSSLTSVSIPSSVTSIGSGVFTETPWLKNQGEYAIVNGILLAYQGSKVSVSIPSSVTSIGDFAFDYCSSLTSVSIPSSVTSIGGCAFYGCSSLTSVSIPSSVISIGYRAFEETPWLKNQGKYAIVNGILIAYQGNEVSVSIPSGVTSVGEGAFKYCSSLTSVSIPSGVTSIGYGAFTGCSSLTSVSIPSGIISIGEGAFGACDRLTDVYFGGNDTQWNAIDIEPEDNIWLTNATIHYSSGTGTETPPAPSNTAYAATQNVGVDNKTVQFQCYALKDENGYPTNYIKLRDVAHILRGTNAQFSIDWDIPTSTSTIVSGGVYQDVGSEMNTPFSGDRTYTVSTSKLIVNGKTVSVEAIMLTDDKGGGYTYFKLRDIGQMLNFNVSWSAERGAYINTDQPYSDAN